MSGKRRLKGGSKCRTEHTDMSDGIERKMSDEADSPYHDMAARLPALPMQSEAHTAF